MKTTPIAKPGMASSTAPTPAAQDARSRAIAKLTPAAPPTQGQSAPIPVNANAVTAEDLSAVQAPKNGQDINTVEETTSTEETVLEASTEAESTEAVEQTPAKPVETPASSQMAILARKERALRAKAQQQDQAYKQREEALRAREAAVNAKDQEYQSGYISKQRIKQDLLGVMAEEGLSYDELTQQLINQQPENPRVKAELNRLHEQNKRLEDKLSKWEASAQENQTNAYKSAINQIRSDVAALVKQDPETYEAIHKTGSHSDVVELIEQTFKEEGRVMSVEDAAKEVEDYLSDEAYKLSELKKVQKRRQAVSTTKPPTQTQTPVQPKQPQPMKTLTNATASSRQLSSKERAILAFKGELKS